MERQTEQWKLQNLNYPLVIGPPANPVLTATRNGRVSRFRLQSGYKAPEVLDPLSAVPAEMQVPLEQS